MKHLRYQVPGKYFAPYPGDESPFPRRLWWVGRERTVAMTRRFFAGNTIILYDTY